MRGIKDLISGIDLFKSKPSSHAAKIDLKAPDGKVDVPGQKDAKPIFKDGLRFQSPIKDTWLNLGAFSPGVATDKNHQKGHNGIDMMAAKGTPVYPLAEGIARPAPNAAGGPNAIIIDHPNGMMSYYAHLGSSKINKGQKVDLDTVIGTVSNEGNFTAKQGYPHLHLEVRKGGSLVNPGNYFPVPAYDSKLIALYEKQNPRNVDIRNVIAMSRLVNLIHKTCELYENKINLK